MSTATPNDAGTIASAVRRTARVELPSVAVVTDYELQGKRRRPDLPPGFRTWNFHDRGDWLAFKLQREGLLRELRKEIDADDVNKGTHLTTDEMGRLLALIYHGPDR